MIIRNLYNQNIILENGEYIEAMASSYNQITGEYNLKGIVDLAHGVVIDINGSLISILDIITVGYQFPATEEQFETIRKQLNRRRNAYGILDDSLKIGITFLTGGGEELFPDLDDYIDFTTNDEALVEEYQNCI